MKGFDFKTFDFRKKIIGLDEETLALFLETRIKDLNIESKWRAGLKEFILQQWDVKSYHPSYEKVYNYLQNHDATELEFKTLDITALFPLIHYYRAIDGSERMYNLTSDSEIEYLTKNQIMDLHSIRNLIEHEVQNLDPDREKRMYLLQLWATERIAGLALLVMTCRDPNEEWKQIYQRAKSIEHDLRGERWLVTSEVKSRSIPKDANMSDICP